MHVFHYFMPIGVRRVGKPISQSIAASRIAWATEINCFIQSPYTTTKHNERSRNGKHGLSDSKHLWVGIIRRLNSGRKTLLLRKHNKRHATYMFINNIYYHNVFFAVYLEVGKWNRFRAATRTNILLSRVVDHCSPLPSIILYWVSHRDSHSTRYPVLI